MSGSTELLMLRLALIAVVFIFVLMVSLSLQRGLGRASVRAVQGRMPKLLLVNAGETGLRPGSSFQLAGDAILGRDDGAAVVLRDASVSSRHARIERSGRNWVINDLQSTNGTEVNGRPLRAGGTMALHNGDEFSLGNVTLQFSV
jgi:hypothetical protein